MLTTVHNLADLQFKASYSCTPRQAVIAAYAQFEKNDFNTGDYKKYESVVVETNDFIYCGDYAVSKG